MALITKDYFIGEINIPDTDKAEVAERLGKFIDKYEEDLLRKLLGNALYKAYDAGIAADTPDQKWIDIRDGKDYTDQSNIACYWIGLRKASTLQSLIANYVYYWWLRDRASQTTALGETLMKPEGGDRVSPATKMTRAWNEMVEWANDLIHFLGANKATYTEWSVKDKWAAQNFFEPINSLNI